MRSFKTEVFISPFGPTIVTLAVGSGEDDNMPVDVGARAKVCLRTGWVVLVCHLTPFQERHYKCQIEMKRM